MNPITKGSITPIYTLKTQGFLHCSTKLSAFLETGAMSALFIAPEPLQRNFEKSWSTSYQRIPMSQQGTGLPGRFPGSKYFLGSGR